MNVGKKCHRDRKNIVSLQNGKTKGGEEKEKRKNRSLQRYIVSVTQKRYSERQ